MYQKDLLPVPPNSSPQVLEKGKITTSKGWVIYQRTAFSWSVVDSEPTIDLDKVIKDYMEDQTIPDDIPLVIDLLLQHVKHVKDRKEKYQINEMTQDLINRYEANIGHKVFNKVL